jgi:hypothetical protein
MDTRGVGAILLKVAGLVLIVMAVADLPSFFSPLSMGANWSIKEAVGTAALILGPLIVLGILLWLFPGTIVNKIVADAPASSQASSDPRPIELVALTFLGIYLVARGIIDGGQVLVFVIATQIQSSEHAFISASIFSRFAAVVLEVLIGVFLCIGAKSLLDLIARLRR